MLKSLELFGFKSFADRTLFEFAPGITCVVGPNGSGKSNVVDAIKWILGDQSAKSLRGKEMADDIFNGSAGRKPSGFAEATLTFDNSAGLFPMEAAEVQIGRRLFRSGDSEYLLNRTPVRLKDVRDLFMGTGAGTAAYSIIEQGRVDQILQANPTARRLVFEEAAGISKYKSRKADAERRLERVAQNLTRLTDIVDEVETQLNATRSQAGKAARFHELSRELKQAWTGLAADDYRHLSQRLSERREKMETLAAEIEETARRTEHAEQQRRETEERLSQIDDLLLAEQGKAASLRETVASLESTIRHQSGRRSDLEAEIGRLRSHLAASNLQTRRAERELSSIDEKLNLFQQEFDQTRAAIEQQEKDCTVLRNETNDRKERLQEQRKELDALQQNRSALVEAAAGLRSQLAGLSRSEERQQQLLQQAEAAVQHAGAELHQRKQELARAQAEQAEAQAEVDRLQSQRSDIAVQQSDTERHLQQLRERRSAAAAKLAVLEEHEQRQEGVAIGVRDILRRAEASHYPPWNGILGVVRDLFEVPLDLAPVIEAALGERAQLIAVTGLGPWLEYLGRGPAPIEGRVGFVAFHAADPHTAPPSDAAPVAQRKLHAAQVPDFSGQPGVIDRADRLVQESSRASGIAARVLSDTWVVQSLDDARRLMQGAGGACRFVTLQGEVLDTSESLFVGTVPHEASLVSRRSELRQLKAEIRQLDRGIESYQQRQTVLGTTLSSQEQQLEQALKAVQRSSTFATEFATRLTASEQQLQQSQASFEAQLKEVEGLARQTDAVQQQLEQNAGQTNELNRRIDELKRVVDDEEQKLQEIEAILDEARQAIRDQQLELARHGERLNSLHETQTRLRGDQHQRIRQRWELGQRLSETLKVRRQTDLQILRDGAAVSELFVELERRTSEQRKIAGERDGLRNSRSAASRQEEELHRCRRRLSDERHALEMEVRDIESQIRVLGERIADEYQTSLEELAANEVSAYADLMRERFPEGAVDAQDDRTPERRRFSLLDFRSWFAGDGPAEPAVEGPLPETACPTFAEVRDELEARVDRLRRKLKSMGTVNTQALDSLEELESRYAHLSGQLSDLQEAKAALEDIIRRINGESRRLFLETFETIRVHFRELFRKLFGGGDADIVLEDPDDVLECGIDIVARPPGKELRSLSLLSGGEKTMTAVALLFAMFKSKPSPYCILDEVDAALDEANVDRYVAVVKEFASMTQFVTITHRKRTMTAADVIYGVTMEQAGVSKRMSVRFEEVAENGEIRTRGAA